MSIAASPSDTVLIRKYMGDPPRIHRDESHPKAPQGNSFYEPDASGAEVSGMKAYSREMQQLSAAEKNDLANQIRATGFTV